MKRSRRWWSSTRDRVSADPTDFVVDFLLAKKVVAAVVHQRSGSTASRLITRPVVGGSVVRSDLRHQYPHGRARYGLPKSGKTAAKSAPSKSGSLGSPRPAQSSSLMDGR